MPVLRNTAQMSMAIKYRLAEHLTSVSKIAREFLQGRNGAEEAAPAGLL